MRQLTLILTMTLAVVLLVAGCSSPVAGSPTAGTTTRSSGTTGTTTSTPAGPSTPVPAPDTPSGSPGAPGSTPTTSTSCPTVYADPSIAFEPPLADGGVLRVGDTGWIQLAGRKADVTVTGTRGAVSLADRDIVAFQSCDRSNSVDWVEVTGVAPGTVTLTVHGDPDTAIRITVRES